LERRPHAPNHHPPGSCLNPGIKQTRDVEHIPKTRLHDPVASPPCTAAHQRQILIISRATPPPKRQAGETERCALPPPLPRVHA
jgi:hypothetical protein